MKSTVAAVLGIVATALMGVVGCTNAEDSEESAAQVEQHSDSVDVSKGKSLFFNATFNGNGRTCGTCHSESTGTINPAQVTARFKNNSSDKLFRHDAADTLGGKTFERVKTHATIIVEVPLPANVSLVGSNARKVALNRGVPTTKNIGLDPVLMADGRAPNLELQAASAITGHAQSSDFSQNQLTAIAAFEKTEFNRAAVKSFAAGGPAPALPEGKTDAQKRGRVFFVDDALQVQNGTAFRCTFCHSGPMLNQTSAMFQNITGGLPAGSRFFDIGTAFVNAVGNPVLEFDFKKPDGTTQRVQSPDPGLALITGDPAHVGFFKIPTMWGAKDTAPYFHNNAAKDLKQLVAHYQLVAPGFAPIFAFTDAHAADIVAYLDLL